MKLWVEKMTPVLKKHEMEALVDEDEEDVTAKYNLCVEEMKSQGYNATDIEYWTNYYLDYMGVEDILFYNEDDEEWDDLVKNAD